MSFLKKFVLFLNVLAGLSLVVAMLSIYIDPRTVWLLAFFGLMFPYLLLLNLFFIFFWIIVRFKYVAISLIAILLTLPVLKTYFGFHFSSAKSSGAHPVKVMSFNVRNFNLYHWNKSSTVLDDIMELIKKEQPDVACFQEFFNADTGKYQTVKRLMKEAGFRDYSFVTNASRKKYGEWGNATFSRYPIINHKEIRIENSPLNSFLYTDIQIDSTVVRVFNVHLESVYLSRKDYEYLNQVSYEQDVEMKPTRQIASKLKHAFLLRAPQALMLKKEIAASKLPVIVCGDFNDTPASFCYHSVSTNLQDAFLASGWGMAPTYSGLFSPYRIDYIMSDKQFSISNYKTHCENYSDHYAIVATLSFN